VCARPTEGEAKPTVYLFYGDDSLAIEDRLRSLVDQYPDPVTADMNRSYFRGTDLDLSQLEEVAKSTPFLADRRLVVLEDASKAVQAKSNRDRLLQLLSELPATTALVLVDARDFSRKNELKSYQSKSPLVQWVRSHGDKGFELLCRLPTGPAFVRWLQEECKSMKAQIEPDAAQLLADYVADDSYLARSELQKLVSYVDDARPIQAADVERLTPLYGQADVFEMVDALGMRQVQRALGTLEHLLQSHDARFAFAMIVRQVRLLIMARQALDDGSKPEDALGVHPYVAGKVGTQAQNFQMAQLETIHSGLLQLDLESKTSRADLVTGMFQLFAGLAP
jgi:DNA polymerase-3 subunit delta